MRAQNVPWKEIKAAKGKDDVKGKDGKGKDGTGKDGAGKDGKGWLSSGEKGAYLV